MNRPKSLYSSLAHTSVADSEVEKPLVLRVVENHCRRSNNKSLIESYVGYRGRSLAVLTTELIVAPVGENMGCALNSLFLFFFKYYL